MKWHKIGHPSSTKAISLDDLTIRIRRRRGVKSLRLSINKMGEPVLTIPFLCSQKTALQWLVQQKEWIQQHRFTPQKFIPNQQIQLMGRYVSLCPSPTGKTYWQENTLYIGGESSFFHRRVKDVIKKELLSNLKQRVQQKAEQVHQTYRHITVRETFSRWGSCSGQGNLSFCWRLALAPDWVIDYLVAHEVSHLKHMNHSPEFWKTVQSLTPYTQQAKIWLKVHGTQLPR